MQSWVGVRARKKRKDGWCLFRSPTMRCLFQFSECNAVLLARLTVKVQHGIGPEVMQNRRRSTLSLYSGVDQI